MARFIEYGGNFSLRQPCHALRAGIHFFGIRGDEERIQALCDLTLNPKYGAGDPVHPDLEYRAISSTVFLLFMQMNEIRSQNPVDAQKGYLQEQELNVAIPVIAWKRLAPLVWIPTKLLWYLPYLWIDTGVPMVCGRETFGFPKTLGRLDIPRALGQTACYAAHTDIWQPFAPTQGPCSGTPVAVRRTDAADLESALHLPDIEAWLRKVLDWLGLDRLEAIVEHLGDLVAHLRETRFVFLKQFRDHVNGDDACYQAIVECPVSYPDFYGADLLQGDFEATITNSASCPILQELGLAGVNAAGDVAVQRVEFAAKVECDFVLGNGQTIWSA